MTSASSKVRSAAAEPAIAPASRRRYLALAALGLLLATAIGCAPHPAMLRSPIAVHLADQPGVAGALRVAHYCDADGVCHIAPVALLDERDVRSVALSPGEGRLALTLELNERGKLRLSGVAQGAGNAGRLTLVVDQRAIEAGDVEQARRQGRLVIRGPTPELQRLYDLLATPPRR